MDSEEKLFLALKRPSFEEMVDIMNKFHSSLEYLDAKIPATERSTQMLNKHGWGFEEYCRVLGTWNEP